MASAETSSTAHRSRLADETSPYLLQHASNPVDWYPWGEEALTRAKREQRPILLSIGYAACHWCHVMERESFCDERTAELMNEHFVCIKVDREERPDLDDIYMAATVAMSGSGGWPMTVFLTPDHEPFFAGTYFPPEDGYGRPGFRSLLERIAELWRTRRADLERQAATLTDHLKEQARPAAPGAVGEEAIDRAVERLRRRFDSTHGGFGGAPKFPAPLALELLLRHHRRTGDRQALTMATTTLDGMARGGIRDHLGGGFARYSTDERWLVPHFEKMLYDNAGLARIYAEASQVTGDEGYRRVARETLDWVLRSMQSDQGGFYSSTDADSEGEEGKYFVWRPEELEPLLTDEEGAAFRAFYDVTDQGNWEGKSVLHTPRASRDVALEIGASVAELDRRLARARRKLLAARDERVPPACDDKVLTAWNGLMIGALAECGRIFDEPRYVAAAARAALFVAEELTAPDGRLWRSHRAGRARHRAVLEDYAYLADGLLDLYEATGSARWLTWSGELARRMVDDFGDDPQGGFYATGREHEPLLVRVREGQDGALPNANAVAARVLARLSFFCDDEQLRHRSADAIAAHGGLIEQAPDAFVGSLRVVDLLLEGPVEVVLVGAADHQGTRALQRELGRHHLPNRVIVVVRPGEDPPPVGEALRAGRGLVQGQPTAYVCRGSVCRAPVTEPTELAAALGGEVERGVAERRQGLSRSAIDGAASATGTARYVQRQPAAAAERGYRQLGATGLWTSRLGFGGYRIDERAPEHEQALRAALRGGCNLIDTSTNYTDGGSERLVGKVVRELVAAGELERDELCLVSKIGYVQGANLELAKRRQREGEPFEEMVRYADDCWHCIHPSFLEDQLGRSLERLGVATLDVCLLHNPEYFLTEAARRGEADLDGLRQELDRRFEQAFGWLEEEVRRGRIRHYGVSSNTVAAPAGDAEATDLGRMLAAARRAGGREHHFAVLQLPLNLIESRAVLEPVGSADSGAPAATVLERARSAGLGVLVNRPFNAFGPPGLIRLAEPRHGAEQVADGSAFGERVDRVAELEEQFVATIAGRLRGVGSRAHDLLRWAPELRQLDGEIKSTDQLQAILYGQILPRTARVIGAVDQAADDGLRPLLEAWKGPYLEALDDCVAALRGQVLERMKRVARSVAERIDPHLDPARQSEPLSRKALWVLKSTPGVDVVLVGMRRRAYVDDVLPVMSWPELEEVRPVYRAAG